jgi:hypothetical protein
MTGGKALNEKSLFGSNANELRKTLFTNSIQSYMGRLLVLQFHTISNCHPRWPAGPARFASTDGLRAQLA